MLYYNHTSLYFQLNSAIIFDHILFVYNDNLFAFSYISSISTFNTNDLHWLVWFHTFLANIINFQIDQFDL